jgi:hypothetical protein
MTAEVVPAGDEVHPAGGRPGEPGGHTIDGVHETPPKETPMTGITVTHATTEREQAARLALPAAAVSTLTGAALSYVGRNDLGEWLFELGVLAVGAVVVFGVVVPRGLRHDSAGGRALALAVVGLLLVVPAFWLGLPAQLGTAAALLGYAGRRAPNGSGKSVAALVLGVVTVVAYLAIYLGDFVATH